MKYSERIDFVKPSAIRESGKIIASKEGCISFAAGYPDVALMPIADIAKVTDELLREKGDMALQYGMTQGYDPLLGQIVELMKEKGVNIEKKNVQITTGSQQGLFLSALAFLDKGDGVIVENPTYLGALSSFAPFGCDFIGVDADENGMRMDKLEEAIKANPNAKIIYCVPNFSNPTGKTYTVETRKRIVELANQYDLLVLEDNPYGEIRFTGEHLPTIKSMDTEGRVIYFGSFSKILFAGLRVGFAIASEEISSKYELLKQGVNLQCNQFAQVQISEYLKQYDLDAQIAEIIEVYSKKGQLMLEQIDAHFPKSIKRTSPEGGMFVWVEFEEGVNTTELLKKAVEEVGVGFVPGGSFFVEPGHDNTMRLNYSTVDEEKIKKGIKALGEFLTKELG